MDIKKLMSMVDDAASIKEDRLALDRRSKELKKEEDDLESRIIQQMQLLGLTSISGHGGHPANIRTSVEPVVTDWPSLLHYIRETGSTDLLHKRLTTTAVKLRWQDGLDLPGVDRYEKTELVIA